MIFSCFYFSVLFLSLLHSSIFNAVIIFNAAHVFNAANVFNAVLGFWLFVVYLVAYDIAQYHIFRSLVTIRRELVLNRQFAWTAVLIEWGPRAGLVHMGPRLALSSWLSHVVRIFSIRSCGPALSVWFFSYRSLGINHVLALSFLFAAAVGH